MRLDRLTNKTREALQAAQTRRRSRAATPSSCPSTSCSRCWSKTAASPSRCFDKAGVDAARVRSRAAAQALESLPRVQRRRRAELVAPAARPAHADLEADRRAQGRVLVGRARAARAGRRARTSSPSCSSSAALDKTKLLAALQQVRGSQRVTDADPEGKYQALEKYTRDLTALPRATARSIR